MATVYQDELDQALKEAMASPDYTPTTIYDTIELYHSAFVDEEGLPSPVYVYNGNQYGEADLNGEGITYINATIEPSADRNAGENVRFIATPMKIVLPEQGEAKRGNFKLKVSGAVSQLMTYIQEASASGEEIKLIFRRYLSTNMDMPAQVDMGAHVLSISVSGGTIEAEGQYFSFLDNYFGKIYSKLDWPRLVGA